MQDELNVALPVRNIAQRFGPLIIAACCILGVYGYRCWLYYKPVPKPSAPPAYAGYSTHFWPHAGMQVVSGPLGILSYHVPGEYAQGIIATAREDLKPWDLFSDGFEYARDKLIESGEAIYIPPKTTLEFVKMGETDTSLYQVKYEGKLWWVFYDNVYSDTTDRPNRYVFLRRVKDIGKGCAQSLDARSAGLSKLADGNK